MIKFEKVSKYKDVEFNMPTRKTSGSAGYDFEVIEDIVIPSLFKTSLKDFKKDNDEPINLKDLANLSKGHRYTLVTTGVKAHCPKDMYLQLNIRSSSALKDYLMLGNSIGIIDSDYADNPDNEGEIFFQVINFSPFDIQLHKGDIIGQGIFQRYYTTDDDISDKERVGGFGSTNEK